jgi:LysR family nitrogen assimilation transcriptional regulator
VPAFAGAPGLSLQPFLQTWETMVASKSRGSHLNPVRLRECGPLRAVAPSGANTRRRNLEIYFKTNHVQVERILELDTMMGSLDFVAASDWVTIVPALMMNGDIKSGQYSVRPIIGPTAALDLVLIEPMRTMLSPSAEAFLEILRAESIRLNDAWRRYFEPADASGR